MQALREPAARRASKVLLRVALAASAAVVPAALLAVTARSSTPPLTPVSASYVVSASAVPLFVGLQQGFYAAHGLDVHPQVVTASSAAVAGVASGQLQFASGAIVTLMQAYSQGIQIELVGPEVSTTKGSICILAKTGTTLAHVRTIALNSLGGTGQLSDEMWLKSRAIDLHSIQYVAVPYSAQLSAIANGTVDAGVIDQPFLSQALTQGGFSCLGDDTIETGPYGSAAAFWFTSRSYAEQNPQVVKQFTAALLRSNVYSATHPGAEQAADSQITGVSASAAASTQFFGYPTAVNLGVLQRIASLGYQFGLIQNQVTVKDMFWPGVRFTRI